MSDQLTFERTVNEAVRRVKLEARNDSNFVPPVDDVSAILAARLFGAMQPSSGVGSESGSGVAVDDANLIIAARVFGPQTTTSALAGGGGQVLTFGTHLTGTSYDGTAPKTIATTIIPAIGKPGAL